MLQARVAAVMDLVCPFLRMHSSKLEGGCVSFGAAFSRFFLIKLRVPQ